MTCFNFAHALILWLCQNKTNLYSFIFTCKTQTFHLDFGAHMICILVQYPKKVYSM